MARMDLGEVGSQVPIQVFKLFQGHEPHTLVHGIHKATDYKGDDAMNQRFLEQSRGHWVLAPPAVDVFRVHR